MATLPTPDEFNRAHPHPQPERRREMAPVRCPHCGSQMFYPDQDQAGLTRVVRCGSRRACVQTTITNIPLNPG